MKTFTPRLISFKIILSLSILLGNYNVRAGYYSGNPGEFSFGFNPSGCTNNTSTISNISIRFNSRSEAYIKFNVVFTVTGGNYSDTYEEYASISGGTANFPTSGFYHWCGALTVWK